MDHSLPQLHNNEQYTIITGADFLGGAGGCAPPKFSSTPSEKFKNGMHTVGYYFYYRFYLKKLIHLAVRVWAYGNIPKKNTTARSAPLVAHQYTPPGKSAPLLSDEH